MHGAQQPAWSPGRARSTAPMAARTPAQAAAQRAPAKPAAAGPAALAVRSRRNGAAEHHQPRRWRSHGAVLGAGGADRDCRRAARRTDDADPLQRAVRGVRLSLRHPAARGRAGLGPPPGELAAHRRRVRRASRGTCCAGTPRTSRRRSTTRSGTATGGCRSAAAWVPSVISEVVIGMGASIGREAAPKLLGGASASVLAGWAGLSVQQRRLLVACGGGAGLAAVYNVPLAGALFTAEILIGSISLPVMLPALACSWIATATAWIYLPDRATYTGIPDYRFSASLMTWALLAGPVIGLISAGYIRLIGWVSYHRARGPPGAVRTGGRVRHPRRHRHLVSAAVRQRTGHGPRRLPRHRQRQPAAGTVRPQAIGHRDVPGQRCFRRLVHSDARHRCGARWRPRDRLDAWRGPAHRRGHSR